MCMKLKHYIDIRRTPTESRPRASTPPAEALVLLIIRFIDFKVGGLEVVVAGGSCCMAAEKQIQPAKPAATSRARKKAQEPLPLLITIAEDGEGGDPAQLARLVIRLRLRVERRADRLFIPWHKLVHLPADNEHSSSRTKKTPLAGVREDSNGGGR
jgi:hypothetical protein